MPSGRIIDRQQIGDDEPPRISFDSEIEIIPAFDKKDCLAGREGIVWATYDKRQAEIIRDALSTQNISCEIKNGFLGSRRLHMLRIPKNKDIHSAIDFIWRENSGLQLVPDWEYPPGSENESFRRWTDGY